MILQENENKKYKNKVYYKYSISVPKSIIDDLGWIKGQKLEYDLVLGKGLILFPEQSGYYDRL